MKSKLISSINISKHSGLPRGGAATGYGDQARGRRAAAAAPVQVALQAGQPGALPGARLQAGRRIRR